MTEKYKLKESFKAHKADFDYCEKIIKKHSKSFYAAFSTLPQQEAMSVYAVYAFCRKADDIVDETANAEELNRLKKELALFEKGEEPNHPVWRALRVVFDTYEMNIEPFYNMIKGQEKDLSFEQPQTQEDLEDYSYYVAGSVGLMLLPLLAPRADELTDDAIALGVAMQITNILRDVGEDIDNDRVYLPREGMEQFGYTTEMLQNKELNLAFINLWEHEATIAEEYYEQSMNLIVHMYDYAKKPLLLSLLFYKEILEAVRLSDYNSLTKRNSVSKKRKLSLLREATSFLKLEELDNRIDRSNSMIPKRMTTKEVILYVAGQLFMDKGFKATSTRDIAENSGITQPNLYHHFKTKEAIYIAVLEKLSSEIKEGLEELVNNPTGSLTDDLVKVLNFLKDNHPANFSIMRHDMTYEISEENHYRLYLTWQDAYLKPIVAIFNHYTQDSSPYTADELARFFYSSIAPFIQKDNRFNKKVEPEKIIHIFVNGIYH